MNTIKIARELQALAQTGLHFSTDPYDRERYERLRVIAAEMLSAQSDVTPDDLLNWSRAEFGYATPKVDVRAFILQRGKLLLIREDADQGRWTLPGGWADVNESPSKSVAREVLEESGYEVEPISLLAVFDRERQGHDPPFPYHVYKLFFHCRIVGGAPRKTQESSESGLFDRSDIPELSVSRVLPKQIELFFDRVADRDTHTLYD